MVFLYVWLQSAYLFGGKVEDRGDYTFVNSCRRMVEKDGERSPILVLFLVLFACKSIKVLIFDENVVTLWEKLNFRENMEVATINQQ